MKISVFLLMTVFVLGCQNPASPPEPTLGEAFELQYGEQAAVSGEEVRLRFEDVLEDSRCPKGVQYFWAGNAKIAVQFDGHRANLNTYLEPRQAAISGFTIELVSVRPYPVYPVDVEKNEYVAEFVVTKH